MRMNWEYFEQETSRIAKELDKIAEITGNMALANSANSDNDRFVAIMTRHAKLLKEWTLLIEEMERSNSPE